MRIFITGGWSMIGRALMDVIRNEFEEQDIPISMIAPKHNELDILDYDQFDYWLSQYPPDCMFALAGWNGGIQFNKEHPAEIFQKNAQMALNTLSLAHKHNVQKVVSVLPSCSYAHGSDVLTEMDFLKGPPHQSVECHGMAKRIYFEYSRQLHRQYGRNYVCCVLNNVMGPYDSFDESKTKVIGGLINRFYNAKLNNLPEVECWGTGSPLRSFLFSEDAAMGILLTMKTDDYPLQVINIDGEEEVSIKEVAETIADVVGYTGKITWLKEKPDGQMRKKLDTKTMKMTLGWSPQTSFREGIEKTVRWYEENILPTITGTT